MREETLLLTGFGAFQGVDDNPSARVALALHGLLLPGWRVHSAVLPVAWQRAHAHVAEHVRACAPRWLVHMGVAAEAKTLRLEAQGANRLQFRIPDVDGLQPLDGPVLVDAPEWLTTRVAIDALVESLQQQGTQVERSDDAGRYVCNATYFSSLHAFGCDRVLFVHVPPVSELQPLARLMGDVTALLRLLVRPELASQDSALLRRVERLAGG